MGAVLLVQWSKSGFNLLTAFARAYCSHNGYEGDLSDMTCIFFVDSRQMSSPPAVKTKYSFSLSISRILFKASRMTKSIPCLLILKILWASMAMIIQKCLISNLSIHLVISRDSLIFFVLRPHSITLPQRRKHLMNQALQALESLF